jgi:cardiolipin synthase
MYIIDPLYVYVLLQLDGYIARRFPSQASSFGSYLDPLADKFLVSILFVSLTAVDLIPGNQY